MHNSTYLKFMQTFIAQQKSKFLILHSKKVLECKFYHKTSLTTLSTLMTLQLPPYMEEETEQFLKFKFFKSQHFPLKVTEKQSSKANN